MEAFKTNKTLRADNEALKNSLEEMENTSSELQANLETAQNSIIEKDQQIAALQEKSEELEAKNTQLVSDLEGAQASLEESKEKIEEAENSAMSKAKEIAASAGHTTKVTPEEEDTSQATLYSKYRALQASDPKAAGEFWKANKDQLTQ